MSRVFALPLQGECHSGAASLGSVRHSAAGNCNMTNVKGNNRLRKRGPRSQLSRNIRSLRRSGGAPADMTSGESVVDMSVDAKIDSPQPFSIFCINIRCLHANMPELMYQVKVLSPHLVLLQETWLNCNFEDVILPGYQVISRRDRSDQENRGGIISFARVDVFNIVCVKVSADAERSWHYLHLDHGTIAICTGIGLDRLMTNTSRRFVES